MKRILVSLLVLGAVLGGGIASADVDANVATYTAYFDGGIGASTDSNGPALGPNGILDRAEAHLLFAILGNAAALHHDAIHTAWNTNLAQSNTDIFVAGFRPVGAAYMTLGDADSVAAWVAFAGSYGMTVNPANYDLTAAGWLGPNGDLDADGYTNVIEFAAAADEAAYLTSAQTVDAPPTFTVTITKDKGGNVASGTPVTFTAVAASGTAPYSYVWKRDTTVVGTDSPTLSLTTAASDSGSYTCEATDSSLPAGTVTSNALTLTVLDSSNLPAMGIAGIALLIGLAGALGMRKIRK